MSDYDEFPASAQQRAIWFVESLRPGTARYHVPAAVELNGPLDVPALRAALAAVVRRHESLRTGFAGPGPVQRVYADVPTDLPVLDDPAGERDLALAPFDLAGPSLLRAGLIRLGPDRHRLVVVAHHLVCDAWSARLVLRDLAAAYAGRPLAPGPIDYADYAVWQRDTLTAEVLAAHVTARRADLTPLAEPLDLPSGPAGTAAATVDAGFADLLAAIAAALHRLTGQEDIVIGVVAAQRDRPELAEMVGCLVNTVPVRIAVEAGTALDDLRARVGDRLLDALDHRDLPFDRLVEDLRPPRDPGRMPLTDVLATWTPEPPAALDLPGLAATVRRVATGTAKAALTVESAGGDVHIEHALPTEVADWFAAALPRFAVAPGTARVGEVDLLGPGEAEVLLAAGRGPEVDEAPATAVERFRSVAARHPELVAVEAGDGRLTYAALADAVEACAGRLVAAGVRAGDRVAVRTGRTTAWPVAMLAAMRAGAAAVPIDPGFPSARVAGMLADAGVAHVLTDHPHADGEMAVIPAGHAADARGGAGDRPVPTVAPDDLAYVVFTSGSTGRPKGVEVEHASLVRMADATVAAFGLGPGDRVLQFASPAFDAAVWDLVLALLSGATLCLAEPVDLVPGPVLRDTLAARRVTYCLVPPSALALVPADRPLPDLRILVSGGEACPAELVARWAPGRRFVNAYGPTEATVVATLWEAGDPAVVPLGSPLPGVHVYLLDPAGRPVPAGLPGELHLGGRNLARGYLGRPDLTAAAFVRGAGGERLYRTGDRAVRTPAGLVYLGRVDDQVKIRGFRVEPAEAERAMRDQPGVRAAAVVSRRARTGTELVGYYVGDGLEPPALRTALAATLPAYLIPAHLVALDALPVTTAGKLDRAALPDPVPAVRSRPARGPLETRIAAAWCRALGVEAVGALDNFFDVGGHSLALAQVHAELAAGLGRDFPVVDLFTYPTVAALAEHLDTGGDRPSAARAGREQAARRLAMRRGAS